MNTSKIAAYMGCLIRAYGPLLTSCPSGKGSGPALILPKPIARIDQIPRIQPAM